MKIIQNLLFSLILIIVAGCNALSQQSIVSTESILSVPEQFPTQSTDRIPNTITPSPTQTMTPKPKPIQTFTPKITFASTPTSQKAVPDKMRKFIGVEHPPLPTGLTSGFGQLIQIDVQYPYVDFALDIVNDDGNDMLWFSKFLKFDEEGHPYWVVVDIMPFPPYENIDDVFIPDGCKYGKDGIVDSEILVIALLDSEAYRFRYVTNDKILKAWRANRAKEAFEEISTVGIECYADMALGSGK